MKHILRTAAAGTGCRADQCDNPRIAAREPREIVATSPLARHRRGGTAHKGLRCVRPQAESATARDPGFQTKRAGSLQSCGMTRTSPRRVPMKTVRHGPPRDNLRIAGISGHESPGGRAGHRPTPGARGTCGIRRVRVFPPTHIERSHGQSVRGQTPARRDTLRTPLSADARQTRRDGDRRGNPCTGRNS